MSIEKSVLVQDYCEKNLTCLEISKKYNIGTTTVKRLIKRYEIPVNNSKRSIKSSILTKSFLEEHYIILNKTCKEISSETGLASSTIGKALSKYGIEKRSGTRKGKQNNKIHDPSIDYTGKTIHDLTILKYVKGGWLCQCVCGQTKIYPSKRLKLAKSCGCRKLVNGEKHHLYKGCGQLPSSLYNKLYEGAINRNLIFDVSIEYLWNLYLEQDKKCAISKVDIFFNPVKDRTSSLDRIDSSIGYIEGNVQWVHKVINQMKWDYNQCEFINWCKLIAKNN